MANIPHFKKTAFSHGMQTIQLASWKWFGDYIQKKLVTRKTYVFRGQRKSSWQLESTLGRAIRNRGAIPGPFDYGAYLEQFKGAARGRRGPHPQELDENDWWALGQHNGLSTPLLDWTESPFVALFFAFTKPRETPADSRAVWVLSKKSVIQKTTALRSAATTSSPADVVDFVNPLTDENARLINQRGLFTKGPYGAPIEKWVQQNFQNVTRCILIKIEIDERKKDRADCLRYLNRMNINHLTLFPDLYGSSRFCTMALEIPAY